jgi:hypothetical protein
MAINKVIFGDETLIDLSSDTVTADKVLTGVKAHGADGEPITGACTFDADTSDATATAAEILAGKTAYNKGNKILGEMKNNGGVAGAITTKSGAYTVPQGYHDGSGKVSISATEQAKLIPANIRQGVVVLGVEGAMSSTEGLKSQSKTAIPTKDGFDVVPDTGFNALVSVTVEPIPYTETNNSAGGITVTIA